MQTHFTLEQLKNPVLAEADSILRACVHCGFCTATCPTFALLGDELDSPRGRIYLIKDMLENDKPASAQVVTHVDRCLSCLSCMTTCPSGVHYMHLVDMARVHIEETHTRPLADRGIRALLATVLPDRGLFRLSVMASLLVRPFAPLFRPFGTAGRRMAAMLALAPSRLRKRGPEPGETHKADGARKGRVVVMSGCAQPVLAPSINRAAIRLLNRAGYEVVLPEGEGCCGALTHHMGKEDAALTAARRNVDVWTRELDGEGLDAILITASGCGTTVKDYGHMLRLDPAYAEKAARIAARTRDISEFVHGLDLGAPAHEPGLTVAYHSACSMQHGQKITREPKALLAQAGFAVKDIAEGHLCCGSAGVYNIMQPEIATRLRDRKLDNIARITPDLIATGNIGCMTQLASGTAIPVVHTIELLDWAYGGAVPEALAGTMAARYS